MSSPHELLELSAQEGARRVAIDFLSEMAATRERLDDPGDVEALHDFRVASRRLRSCLGAYRQELDESLPKPLRRRLRTIARATGGSRDLEVHLAWLGEQESVLEPVERAGLAWLVHRLTERKAVADRRLRDALVQLFPRLRGRLLKRLSTYTCTVHVGRPGHGPGFAAVTGALVLRHVDEMERDHAAIRSSADEEEAHRARLAGKRLRYLLEPVQGHVAGPTDLVRRLRKVQDLLGELHDAQAFAAELDRELGAAGRERAQRPAIEWAATTERGALQTDDPGDDPRPGLLALIRSLREREARAFGALESSWLGDRAKPLFAAARALGRTLAERETSGVEIERKYLLSALPPLLRGAPSIEVRQGWLPGRRLVERLRHIQGPGGERWFRTVKVGAGVARLELEEETSGELFERLWLLTDGRRVSKRRYAVTNGEAVWEIDEFLDRDLVLAEIELPDPDTEVRLPDWLRPLVAREVTDDPAYTNRSLAR